MTSIFKCSVLLRVYTLFISGLYAYAQLTCTETLMYRVAHSDSIALLASWVMAVCVVLGAIDLFINDLLPEHFVLLRALRDRHLVLMAISLCFTVQMYTAVTYDHATIILAFYSVYVLLIPLSVMSDIRTRYKFKAA